MRKKKHIKYSLPLLGHQYIDPRVIKYLQKSPGYQQHLSVSDLILVSNPTVLWRPQRFVG